MCGKLPAASAVLKRIKRSDKLSASFSSLAISAHSFHVSRIPEKSNAVVALEPAVAGGTTAPWAPASTPWRLHVLWGALSPAPLERMPPGARVSPTSPSTSQSECRREGAQAPPEGSAGSCQLMLQQTVNCMPSFPKAHSDMFPFWSQSKLVISFVSCWKIQDSICLVPPLLFPLQATTVRNRTPHHTSSWEHPSPWCISELAAPYMMP